jgi:RNA polymerase sigma factor (sigma-70 family)
MNEKFGSGSEPSFSQQPETPEAGKKIPWDWPKIEGVVTPEKKKKFWEELLRLRPNIRVTVAGKLGAMIPTAEVDLLTDHIIQQLAQKIDRFDQDRNISTWGYVVIQNAISDARRRYKVDKVLRGMPQGKGNKKPEFEEYDIPDKALGPEDKILQRQNKRQIVEAISELSEKLRTVLRMYYLEGMGQAEISGALGLPPVAVRKRIFDGRKILLARLAEKNKFV